jgi:hypothetical protein
MLSNHTTHNPEQQNIPNTGLVDAERTLRCPTAAVRTTFRTTSMHRGPERAHRHGWPRVDWLRGELSLLENCIVDADGKVQCPTSNPPPTTI